MGTDAAIADVGETLVTMLRDRMDDLVGRDEIALAAPSTVENGTDARLTLYLYRIEETADLKNERRQSVNGTTLRDPPLALDLYYLLTAHPSTGGTDETERSQEQHAVLGRAMQVIADNGIIRGSDLRGSLSTEPQEEVRIAVEPTDAPSLDTMVSLWGTFPDQPFQPSVSYLVSPVRIASERERPAGRVVEKEDRYYGGVGDGSRRDP